MGKRKGLPDKIVVRSEKDPEFGGKWVVGMGSEFVDGRCTLCKNHHLGRNMS